MKLKDLLKSTLISGLVLGASISPSFADTSLSDSENNLNSILNKTYSRYVPIDTNNARDYRLPTYDCQYDVQRMFDGTDYESAVARSFKWSVDDGYLDERCLDKNGKAAIGIAFNDFKEMAGETIMHKLETLVPKGYHLMEDKKVYESYWHPSDSTSPYEGYYCYNIGIQGTDETGKKIEG